MPSADTIVVNTVDRVLRGRSVSCPRVVMPRTIIYRLRRRTGTGESRKEGKLGRLRGLRRLRCRKRLSVDFGKEEPAGCSVGCTGDNRVSDVVESLTEDRVKALLAGSGMRTRATGTRNVPMCCFGRRCGRGSLSVRRFFSRGAVSVRLGRGIIPVTGGKAPKRISFRVLGRGHCACGRLGGVISRVLSGTGDSPGACLRDRGRNSFIIRSERCEVSVTCAPFSRTLRVAVMEPMTGVDLSRCRLSRGLLGEVEADTRKVLVSNSPKTNGSAFMRTVTGCCSSRLGGIMGAVRSPESLRLPSRVARCTPLRKDVRGATSILLLMEPSCAVCSRLEGGDSFGVFTSVELTNIKVVKIMRTAHPVSTVREVTSEIRLNMVPSVMSADVCVRSNGMARICRAGVAIGIPAKVGRTSLTEPMVRIESFRAKRLGGRVCACNRRAVIVSVSLMGNPRSNRGRGDTIRGVTRGRVLEGVEGLLPGGTGISIRIASPRETGVCVPRRFVPGVVNGGNGEVTRVRRAVKVDLKIRMVRSGPVDGAPVRMSVVRAGGRLVLSLNHRGKEGGFSMFVNKRCLLATAASGGKRVGVGEKVRLSSFVVSTVRVKLRVATVRGV